MECRRCSRLTEEAGLHADCQRRLQSDLEMYLRLAAEPEPDLSIRLTYSLATRRVHHHTWREYYLSRAAEVKAILRGPPESRARRRLR